VDSGWKAWTDAKTAPKAGRVFAGLTSAIQDAGFEVSEPVIEPYEKTGGHTATFAVILGESPWPEVVVARLALAQGIGQVVDRRPH
jgi:hypothetical protein